MLMPGWPLFSCLESDSIAPGCNGEETSYIPRHFGGVSYPSGVVKQHQPPNHQELQSRKQGKLVFGMQTGAGVCPPPATAPADRGAELALGSEGTFSNKPPCSSLTPCRHGKTQLIPKTGPGLPVPTWTVGVSSPALPQVHCSHLCSATATVPDLRSSQPAAPLSTP